MAGINCVVVTPEETAIDQTASFIALPLFDGEIGIAAGHSPMIGRLGYGELRLRQNGVVQRYYVDGGFVQVADNVVSVLTGRLVPADEVDESAAAKQLREARRQSAHSPALMELRDRAVLQARAQLRIAQRTKV